MKVSNYRYKAEITLIKLHHNAEEINGLLSM